MMMPPPSFPPALILVSPAWPYRPINMMWADFAAELRRIGLHAMSYTARNTGKEMLQDMQGALQELIHWPGPKLILSCNGNFLPPVAREGGRLISFAERYGIPLWTLMIDEPALHASRLRAAPPNSFVTIVDSQHHGFVESRGLARKGIRFFAHGGPRPVSDVPRASERPLGPVFIGDVLEPPPYEAWLRETAGAATVRDSLDRAMRACLRPDCTRYSYQVLTAQFEADGITVPSDTLEAIVANMEIFIHQHRRLDILERITAHRVEIFGTVARGAAARLGQHRIHGRTSWARGVEAMRQARFLLNPVAVFKTGGHPRLTYGLANGCLPLATPTSFCDPVGTDDPPLAFDLMGDGSDDDRIADAAALPDLDDRQAAVVASYAARHGWDRRAREARELIDTFL